MGLEILKTLAVQIENIQIRPPTLSYGYSVAHKILVLSNDRTICG